MSNVPEPNLTIISGIGPDASGTGTLIRGLMQEGGADTSTVFVHKRARGRHPVKLARYYLNRAMFPWLVRRAAKKGGEVLVFHPQTLGASIFQSIMDSRESVWLYVLDASPFCVRSYNCLPAESSPCLRCLGNDGRAAQTHGCKDPFRAGPIQEQMSGWVRSGRLRLIAQCESQAALLRKHYGQGASVVVVPLSVPDISPPPEEPARPKRPRPMVVYHGAPSHAKGLAHVIALAERMPDLDFLVPSSQREVQSHFQPADSLPANLLLKAMNWDSGLAEEVRRADAVLCPSSWSSPVEGAVLKSLAHNGLVGLYVHESSFAAEIPPEASFCVEPGNMDATVARLRHLLAHPLEAAAIRKAARLYIAGYRTKNRDMLRQLRAACGVA